MKPEIDLLGLPLKTFGLMFALGFLAAGAVLSRRLKEQGRPVDWSYELIFAGLAGGLIGSRLAWIAQNWDEASDDLVGALFSGSGLVWYGGAIGGAIFVCVWAWRRGILGIDLLDLCAPALALGYAIGRIGCQISGDGDYGQPTDLPWGMPYPEGTVPTTDDVHPTPIYETFGQGMLAWGLWTMRDRVRPGVVFAVYLLIGGLERFLVEFIRRNDPVAIGLTTAQFESALMMLAGAVWLIVLLRGGGLRAQGVTPAAPGGRTPRPATA